MFIRDRGLETWGVLFAIAVCLAGCDPAADESGYHSFGSVPENEVSSPENQPREAVASQSEHAKIKADPIQTIAAADVTPKANEAATPTDPPPLVAVKPVLAENPGAIKNSIDNATIPASTEREIKLLVKAKSFKQEGPENSLRVSYDDFDLLKILNMEPVPLNAVEYFPGWLTALDGKKVRVRGFMYPPFKEEGLKEFILARDNQICCFGKNPKIYDLVYISMRDGVSASYIQNRPFDVVGTFRIHPDAEDGEWFSLYQIEDSIVIDR
jgi:hypothetical protein